jgi:hypothetical protein
MKLNNTLKAIAIILPSLAALPVDAGFSHQSGGATGDPFYWFAEAGTGFTEALFTNGVSTTIAYKNYGLLSDGTPSTVDSGNATNCTFWEESNYWNSTAWRSGESKVTDTVGNDGYGEAFAEVY